jgi:hypothetical protein
VVAKYQILLPAIYSAAVILSLSKDAFEFEQEFRDFEVQRHPEPVEGCALGK